MISCHQFLHNSWFHSLSLSLSVCPYFSSFLPQTDSKCGENCGELYDFGFAEQRDGEKRAIMLSEFNTLAVTFGTPSIHFVEEKRRLVSGRINYFRFIFFILVFHAFIIAAGII